ncbi:MAG: hypothetical protein JWQ09_5222 [Segetibacter sp.]|nr:hypothetical protein [Segetibacter sp.]
MYSDRNSFSNYYTNAVEEIRLKLMAEPDDFIIGTDTDEITTYYYTLKALVPIVIDPERTESIEVVKEVKIVPAHRREIFYQSEDDLPYEYEWLKLTLPIIPHRNISQLLQLRPDSFGLGGLRTDLNWKQRHVEYNVEVKGYGYDHDEPTVLRRLNEKKQSVTNYIHIIASNIESGNSRLDTEIRNFLRLRKEKLKGDQDKYRSLFKQINIPLKRKEDEVVTCVLLDTNQIVKNIRPTAHQPEIYVIDRSKILDIIHILNNQGRQFEKTPNTFKDSGENDFRNILLVNLNCVFEGKATGETFNNKGKTDIHLNIAKGDILVCECKIWAGGDLYKKTIDQLLGYLTWRESYGIMITFIRNTKPSTVLKEAPIAIQSHESYSCGFHPINTTHFTSHHYSPIDRNFYVELHHLFYNI